MLGGGGKGGITSAGGLEDKRVKKGLRRVDLAMGQGTGKINIHLAVFSSVLTDPQGNASECWDIYSGLMG